MMHNYVAIFGDATPNVPVQVTAAPADDAVFVSQTAPPAMIQAAQAYSVAVTMKNNGTSTWTTGPQPATSQPTGYMLVAQNPTGTSQWNTIPGIANPNNAVPISATGASSVAPGQTATFNFVVNAPSSGPGAFNFQWQMMHNFVAIFGDATPNVACTIGTDNAAFVSQSPPPSAMVAGQSYPVSVTMQNTGTATWADGTCQILSENPRGNQYLGVSSHPIVGAVAPGQTVTVSFNAVAPATPGVYNFQWSLSRNGIHEFGQFSTNVAVTVNAAPTPPTVATPASATPSPVTGTTTALSVLGADAQGESALTYTWSTTGTPPAPVTFSANGTNAAKNTGATFTKAGAYTFQVVLTNAAGLTATSTVAVAVNSTLTTVNVTPFTAAVGVGATQQFAASATDQFGAALSPAPAFTWSVAAGGGSISTSGLYTAPAAAGSATVQALSGGVSGTASVTITAPAPSVASLSLSPSSVVGGSPSTGTVTLTGPAPAGGVSVDLLSSDVNTATVPASMTVPAGATSATFTVSTVGVASATPITVSATAGGVTQTAMLMVNPPTPTPLYLSNLTVSPAAIIGGSGTTGTVTLSSPAPAGGTTVVLSSNSNAVVVPSNVVIPQGSVGQTFPVTTSSVSSMTYATLTAKSNNWTQAAIATVLPANQSYVVQNLVASAGNQCVVLNWADLPPESNEGYKVYRNGALLTPTPQEGAMFADNAVTNGTTYQYAVSVINSQGQEINLSSAVAATPSSSSGALGWVNPPTTAVSGDLVLYATLSSGVNADGYAFVVDGKEVGEGGQQPDDNSGSPGQVSVTLDTTSLSNGTHTVQLISEVGGAPAATPSLIIQTNNPVSNKSLNGLVDLSIGEVFSMSAVLPSTAATWTVNLTDDDTGNTIASWQGTGTTVHLSWDGTGNTGGFYHTAHVTAKDSSGNVVAGAFGSSGGTGGLGGGGDFPAHTYSGTVHGLALVDYISPKRAHDVALETTIKNSFKQMHSNDGTFTGLVLDPTAAGTTKQQKYSVYKKIQVLMNLDLYDFYLYGHGEARQFANSPKQQRARWVTANYFPFMPADPTQYNIIHADPVTNTVVANVALRPYNFVFIDTCYSAGGQSQGANETNPGEPVLTDWQKAFHCDEYNTENGSGGTFFGWNGWCVRNTNGDDLSQSLWLYWRETFWTNVSMGGTSVEQAANKATQQTQLEIRVGNLRSTYMKPWDSVGSYYRSYRSPNTIFTYLP